MLGKLKSFTIDNFGPFAEETTFSTMSDTTRKEFLEVNTFEQGDSRYNRVSYIYGRNGAGKSNFCKALLQVQSLLSISPLMASENPKLLDLPYLRKHYTFEPNFFKLNKK